MTVNNRSKIVMVWVVARSGVKEVSEMPETTFEMLWSTIPVFVQKFIGAAVSYAEKLW